MNDLSHLGVMPIFFAFFGVVLANILVEYFFGESSFLSNGSVINWILMLGFVIFVLFSHWIYGDLSTLQTDKLLFESFALTIAFLKVRKFSYEKFISRRREI